jgi:hypothetical protein
MNLAIKELMHPRIINYCEKLFNDCHYKHAALEAMTQVELVLKEKSGEKLKYGVNLVSSLLGEDKGIKLRVPFSDKLQKSACRWFEGSFSYYRNYLAHDGSKVDKLLSTRIMVIASDLLDLIGASSKSFTKIGGVRGLIQRGIFKDEMKLKELLQLLDSYYILDDVTDGFWEELAYKDFGEDEVTAVIEVGLVEYISKEYIPTANELKIDFNVPDEIAWFILTKLGEDILKNK